VLEVELGRDVTDYLLIVTRNLQDIIVISNPANILAFRVKLLHGLQSMMIMDRS
jgi:hypothetical protein